MIRTTELPPFLSPIVLALFALVCSSNSVVAQPGIAEILRNGAFEGGSGPNGQGAGVPRWEAVDAGYDIDRNTRHGGDQAIRCDNLRPTARRGASCFVELNQLRPTPILVTGWSKADAVSGTLNPDYALYIDLVYTDGTTLWGQSSPFRPGTHVWERRRVLIFPAKPIKAMTVNALFRNHSGTAWFDDFSAHAIEGDGLFDSQLLQLPARGATATGKPVTVTAKDGLSVTLDSQGAIRKVRAGSQDVSGPTAGGFFLRDVARDAQPAAVAGATSAYHGTGANFFSSPPGMGIRFYAKIVPDGDALAVDGELTDTTSTDRAVTVYLALPVGAEGWLWGQDIRRSSTIDAHRENSNLVRVNVGATGGLSLYPLGMIGNSAHGVGIASQMDWPSVYRIFYNGPTHQFVIAWDFALTGKTAAWPSHNARFRCRLFHQGADAGWGFRAAAQRFYRLNSPNFDRKAKAEGIWMPFTKPETVTNASDFGIAYHEGDTSVAADDRAGILSFRYTEPMSWWMPMPPEMPRTYEAALGLVSQLAASTDPKKKEQREMARALLNSGTQDSSGRFNLEFRNEPWANGAVFLLNPNPELPSGPDTPTRSSVAYSVADAIKRYGPETSRTNGTLDGEYLDSLEGWSDVLDYRPSSLQACPYPITFETDSRVPVVPQWYSTHTFTRYLRDDLHNRGKLLMANSVPIRFSIFAPLLDVMGIEVNWLDSAGGWQPESDETLSMRRTLSYQKPYLLLQNTNFDRFTPELVEKYFQRCLFYGIYPSMFSADAATNPYWDTPKLYNRDRPLFKTYIPIVKKLSAAGWEPITFATVNEPKVYVERYGPRQFTLLNDSSAPANTTVSIDLGALRIPPSGIHAVDMKTKIGIPSQISGTTLRLQIALQPDQSLAIELQ